VLTAQVFVLLDKVDNSLLYVDVGNLYVHRKRPWVAPECRDGENVEMLAKSDEPLASGPAKESCLQGRLQERYTAGIYL